MSTQPVIPKLMDRKALCRYLGNVSVSHVIRLENAGVLSEAKLRIGKRLVRYDMQKVFRLIQDGQLSCSEYSKAA